MYTFDALRPPTKPDGAAAKRYSARVKELVTELGSFDYLTELSKVEGDASTTLDAVLYSRPGPTGLVHRLHCTVEVLDQDKSEPSVSRSFLAVRRAIIERLAPTEGQPQAIDVSSTLAGKGSGAKPIEDFPSGWWFGFMDGLPTLPLAGAAFPRLIVEPPL